MSKAVNSVLGHTCVYRLSNGNTIPDANITINKNNPVRDEFKNLLGYEITASILKEDLPQKPSTLDYITDDEGREYKVGSLREETESKWYVSLVEV